MKLVDYLSQLRKARGWSYGDLSKACGLSRGFLHTVEHGRSDLTVTSLAAIARAYDMTASELLAHTDCGGARPCSMCGAMHSGDACPFCGFR